MRFPLAALLLCLSLLMPATADAATHGLALYGEPKYPADFQNLDYANVDAPKGGTFKQAAMGSYDSLNPFILKGEAADGVGQTFASLLAPVQDEPFSAYAYVAEKVELAPDRLSIIFTIRPTATFHDGSAITAADVLWSFNTLKAKGSPFYRSYYSAVSKAEALDKHRVKFTFATTENRELPLIVGQMPILSEASFKGKDFAATTLQPILGSGPYKISDISAGRSLTLERVKGWWGENLPVNKGRYNFDRITYDYYRDITVAFEAFAAGKLDFRLENVAKNWAQGYNNLPGYKSGQIIKTEIMNNTPAAAQGFAFNLRKPVFQDPRVRQALAYAFDFEWENKTLAFGAYKRIRSYFDNTELAAKGTPDAAELALLEPLRDKLPPEVFTTEYQPPVTDASGNNRANMQKALELLKAAGWEQKDGALRNAKGEAMTFEIVDYNAMLERWVQPFLRNLERLGIKASYRVIDTAQYQNRINDFNFDMTISVISQSLSPGNEQLDFWGSDKADIPGSRNIIGIKNPAVDALIAKMIAAPDRPSLIAATRALDRVLTWNHYIIPQWYTDRYRLAYWNRLGMPPKNPPYGLALDTWWAKAN